MYLHFETHKPHNLKFTEYYYSCKTHVCGWKGNEKETFIIWITVHHNHLDLTKQHIII